MPEPFDSILLIAFGGPTQHDEVRPFLANVTRGRPIPPQRLAAVADHYELIGGRSPLNELTFRQAAALTVELCAHGPALPVFVGMRNWHPFLHETLAVMAAAGHRRTIGVILSAQQSEAGWQRYVQDVADARAAVSEAPEVVFAPPWPTHPLFIEAVADRTAAALATIADGESDSAHHLIFTAHSVPTAMANVSPYVAQIEAGARAVAQRLGCHPWSVAYQSRSGNPHDPWLEPDISEALRALAASGVRSVVVTPIGFVCDHVEVLYDLDIEARAVADQLGIHFVRAVAVDDHPAFIRMLAELVRRTVAHDETSLNRWGQASVPAQQLPFPPPADKPNDDFYTSRRKLPHWRSAGACYFLTWRLEKNEPGLVPEERTIVANALRHLDGTRYHLAAYVVMNDHVHALLTPVEGYELQEIVHSLKSYTTNVLHKETGRRGRLWQKEYYDRIVRDEADFLEKAEYILGNPRKRWPEIDAYPWVGAEGDDR
jgi:ferrochelatase